MSAGGGGAPQQGDDNAMNILWAIVGLFLLGTAIWIAFQEHLKFFFLQLRTYELTILNFIFHILPLDWLNLGDVREDVDRALSVALTTEYQNLTVDVANYLSTQAGNYFRYPVAVCFIVFAYFSFFKNVTTRYKKRYDMYRLAEQESVVWPQIKPILGLNLVEEPLNSGPWAMASNPLDFCKKNQLISISVEKHDEFKHGNPNTYKIHLDHQQAEALFVKQLGRLWRTPEYLPIHQRALFAVLLARACREPKVAAELLLRINNSVNYKNPGMLDFSTVDIVWPKYYNQKIIQEAIKSHSYEYTVFIDLLFLARQDGVLATADFLWIKPMDRLFWYVLNSAGRQTYFVEAAGVYAHFLVEKSLGRPLSVPYVKEAVKALQLALDDILYVPSEEEKEQLLSQQQD